MHPVLLRLGPLTVHTYGALMALGFLLGLLNWRLASRGRGWTMGFLSDLLLWLMIAGIVGGRLAYVLTDLPHFLAQPWRIVRVDEGGLVFYGGFLGAVAGLAWFARARGESFLGLADLAATSLPLAHALGRIGCFFNGCCHGPPCAGPLGVPYPAGSLAWHEQVAAGLIAPTAARSLPVHPVQLYEAAGNLLVFAALWPLYRRRPARGVTIGVYLLLYPAVRFALEFLRGDARFRWAGLSLAQWTSLALFALGAAILIRARRRAAERGP